MAGSENLPRVLLVGGDGHPSGVPRHIRHLIAALEGHVQITVASDHDFGGYSDLAGMGVQHIEVQGLKSSLSPLRLWRGMRGLLAVLHRENTDLVWLHARLPVLLGRLALMLRLWRPHAPVAITFHGLPFGPGHRPGMSALSQMIERTLLGACPPLDLIFLTEAQLARMRVALGPRLDRHRCHILSNCSDLGPLLPPDSVSGLTWTANATGERPKRRNLVMTGRCGWQKNYTLAVRFFAHLPEDFTLTLCGSGTNDPGFRAKMAARAGDEVLRRIHFAGPLADIRPILASADGYLLCARYEGQPIGALEAFEAGLPLIFSRFEGSEVLAAPHPHALRLGFDDLTRDACAVADLVDDYLARRPEAQAEIRTAWALRWSPQVFGGQARALVSRMLSKDRL